MVFRKKTNIDRFDYFSVLFGCFRPDWTLIHRNIKGKVSTDGSIEEWSHPGSTLSYAIVQFHLSEAESDNLAMSYRLTGLRLALAVTAGPNLAA